MFESGIYSDFEGQFWWDPEPCANRWRSLKCRCVMEPISCVPTDNYDLVIQCDNTLSMESTECNYIKVT